MPLIGRAKKSLLRVEQTTTLDGKPRPEFDMTLWSIPGRGPEDVERQSRRHGDLPDDQKGCPVPAPAGRAGAPPFDQIASSVIKVSPPIARPSASRLATYRISLKDDDPAQVIPADRRQSLKPGGAKPTAILDAQDRRAPCSRGRPRQVEPEYLRPNAMIDSADARVVELSPHGRRRRRRAVGEGRPDRGVGGQEPQGQELRGRVRPRRARSHANLSGDCTEHGVLTAAMCRAVGCRPASLWAWSTPSRSAGSASTSGTRSTSTAAGWPSTPPTTRPRSTPSTSKLAESSLDGVAPFEALLPVARVLGKMTIVPVEVR